MRVVNWFGKQVKVVSTKRHYRDEVARVLDRAADLFDEIGWVKGEECGPGGKVCAVGAIALAADTPFKVYDGDESYADFFYNDASLDQEILREKAALAASLVTKPSSIITVNDRTATKLPDVQKKLRDAATAVRNGDISLAVKRNKYGDRIVVGTYGNKALKTAPVGSGDRWEYSKV